MSSETETENEKTNGIIRVSLSRLTDVSHSDASAVMRVTVSDLVSLSLYPSFLSLVTPALPISSPLHWLSTRPSPCLPRAVRSVSDWRAQSEEGPRSS